MILAEEFLYDGGAPHALPADWSRRAVQWLGVVLAHAVVIGFVLQMSPQARQTLDEVIQASIIAPQPLPEAKPQETLSPPQSPPKMLPYEPEPILVAAPSAKATPAAFFVAEPPAEPTPVAPSVPIPSPVEVQQPAVEAPPPPLVPPIFNADYLENPPPQYPLVSRRLGEKGRVLLRAFVSAAGHAEHVEISTSSGFERLDIAACEAVANWRFVPARRGEKRVAAWVLVPVSFVM